MEKNYGKKITIKLTKEQSEILKRFERPKDKLESYAEYNARMQNLMMVLFGDFLASDECKAISRKLGEEAGRKRREYIFNSIKEVI